MQVYHIVPLVNAIIFTVGALCIKRATTGGVGPWRTTFVSNAVLFLVASPFWFFGKPIEGWETFLMPLVLGSVFFLGQLFACLAIHKGDVSLVTPLLGTKTVMVAAMVTIGLGEALSASVWLGSILSTLAIVILGSGNLEERKRVMPSLLLGLTCSLAYAAVDVLTQAFGPRLGFEKLLASSFTVVMLLSFLLIPFFKSSIRGVSSYSWTWMIAGALCLAAQATAMAYVLTTYGKATVVNVIYSSRGIWSVVLVWFVGHWFSNAERSLGGGTMGRRLISAGMMVAAILLVMK